MKATILDTPFIPQLVDCVTKWDHKSLPHKQAEIEYGFEKIKEVIEEAYDMSSLHRSAKSKFILSLSVMANYQWRFKEQHMEVRQLVDKKAGRVLIITGRI